MTDKEVSNLTSSMSALTKQMEKISAQQLLQSKEIGNQKKDFEEIYKSSQKLEDSYDNQEKYWKKITSSMKEALTSSIKIGGTLATIGTVGFATNIIKDLIDLDNKMTALSVRMGKGHKGIKELKTTVTDLQKEFGTGYENAVNFVEELAKEKYVGNIKEAAAGIDLFSRATDVSSETVLELTNNLSKMGGLSTDAINSIYASMLKTQQIVGISDKGMRALVNTINDMASNMVAFGKSDAEIKKMAVSTTALVGAFEEVGVSASRTTQLINQLTDPDNIENNIMLYSQLGITMEDAMSGNFNLENYDSQIKDMAERIVQMGPIAGSRFAKSMGMSFKEISRMAEVEAGAGAAKVEEAMTPEEQALETMKSLEKNTEGIGKRLETALNKVEGKIKGLPTALLVGAAFVIPFLVKKGKDLFHKIFDKKDIQASMETAMIPAVESSFNNAKAVSSKKIKEISNILENQNTKVNIDFTDIKDLDKLSNKTEENISNMFAKDIEIKVNYDNLNEVTKKMDELQNGNYNDIKYDIDLSNVDDFNSKLSNISETIKNITKNENNSINIKTNLDDVEKAFDELGKGKNNINYNIDFDLTNLEKFNEKLDSTKETLKKIEQRNINVKANFKDLDEVTKKVKEINDGKDDNVKYEIDFGSTIKDLTSMKSLSKDARKNLEDYLKNIDVSNLDSLSESLEKSKELLNPRALNNGTKAINDIISEIGKIKDSSNIELVINTDNTADQLESAIENMQEANDQINEITASIEEIPEEKEIEIAVNSDSMDDIASKLDEIAAKSSETQASVATAVVPSMVNGVKKAGGIIEGQVGKLTNVVKGNISQWFDSTPVGGFFNGLDRRVDASVARLGKESFVDKFLGASKQNLMDETSAKIEELNAKSEKVKALLADNGVDTSKVDIGNQAEMTKAMDSAGVDKKKRKAIMALAQSYGTLNNQVKVYEAKQKNIMTKEMKQNAVSQRAADLAERQKALMANQKAAEEAAAAAKKKTVDINLEKAKIQAEINRLEKENADPNLISAMSAKAKALDEENEALEENIEKLKLKNKEEEENIKKEAGNIKKDQEAIDKMPEEKTNSFKKLMEGAKTKIKTSFDKTTLGQNLDAARSSVADANGGKQGKLGVVRGAGVVAKTAVAGAAKGVGKLGLKALGGIAKGIGGLAKTFGPMAIVSALLGKLLNKIKDPLEKMMDSIIDKLAPVVEALLPAIEVLMNTIAKYILPPILTIAGYILKAIHVLLSPLIWILKALEGIPVIGKALAGVGETLEAATGPQVSDALIGAASTLNESGVSMEESSEKTEEAAEKITAEENEPITIVADGASLKANGYTDPGEQANERMTSTTTTVAAEKDSSKENLEAFKKERETAKREERLDEIKSNSGNLPKILILLEKILEEITGKDIEIFSSEPSVFMEQGGAE